MQTEGYVLLNPFVGKWKTEGWIKGDDGKPDIQISGTDTYEWLPGEFLLFHRIDVKIGEERKEGIEIIGYDASTNTFPMHYFDRRGNAESMQASINDGVWRFQGESIRFTGSFSKDGMELSGIWEQKNNDSLWTHLMEIKLNKNL
jgi:hypothetical protein